MILQPEMCSLTKTMWLKWETLAWLVIFQWMGSIRKHQMLVLIGQSVGSFFPKMQITFFIKVYTKQFLLGYLKDHKFDLCKLQACDVQRWTQHHIKKNEWIISNTLSV